MLSPGYSTIEPGNERSLSTYVNEDGKVRRALNTPEHSTVRIYNLNILHLTVPSLLYICIYMCIEELDLKICK